MLPTFGTRLEVKREREFIQAANSLKTLRVTPEGGMSIDPEDIREQMIASRDQLKPLVHKPVAPPPMKLINDPEMEQESNSLVEAPWGVLDCMRCLSGFHHKQKDSDCSRCCETQAF